MKSVITPVSAGILLFVAMTSAPASAAPPSQSWLIAEKIVEALFLDTFNLPKALSELNKTLKYGRWTKNDPASEFAPLAPGFEQLDGRPENQLAFVNQVPDFQNINPLTIGYCWGHATVTRAFNHFAVFSGTGGNKDLETTAGRRRVEKLIDSVLAFKRTEISGFRNLYEFSSNPAVEDYLKKAVVRTWTNLAVSYRAVRAYVGNLRQQTPTQLAEFVDRVESRLGAYQKSKIYFVRKSAPASGHILLANRVEIGTGGRRILCLIDNDLRPDENSRCQSRFEFENDGSLSYIRVGSDPTEDSVRYIGFVPEEKSEIVSMTQALK